MNRFIIPMILALGVTLFVVSPDACGEVYRWVDKDGVVHFGDRAPEGVEATPVRVRPNTVQSVAPQSNKPADTAVPDTEAAAGTGEEPRLSFAEQRREDRAARRMENQKEAQQIQRNCEIMRRQKAFVEPSPRVLVDDGSGGTRRLDDNEREQMLNEANAYLAENCD